MEIKFPVPNRDLVEQVIQRDLQWAQAHRDLDLDLIEHILSEDYRQRQPDGTFKGKNELLASYSSGNRSWEIAESTDHHVQVVGNLAVLIGNWRGKGVNNRVPFNYSARYLSIYKLDGGIWQMILDVSISVENYI